MPTGYTAAIIDGDGISFPDFVLYCARAFGAMVMLRDSDQSLEATKRYIETGEYAEPSDYNRKALAKHRAEIEQLEAMSDEDAVTAAVDEYMEAKRAEAKDKASRLLKRARYTEMLRAVRAWKPPTKEHVGLKEFMEKQIAESIDFDCRDWDYPLPPEPTDALAWRAEKIAKEYEQIAYHVREIEKERERNAGRVAWVTALIESLETSVVTSTPEEKE